MEGRTLHSVARRVIHYTCSDLRRWPAIDPRELLNRLVLRTSEVFEDSSKMIGYFDSQVHGGAPRLYCDAKAVSTALPQVHALRRNQRLATLIRDRQPGRLNDSFIERTVARRRQHSRMVDLVQSGQTVRRVLHPDRRAY